MLALKYFEKGYALLTRLQDSQMKNIERAAEMIAQAISEGHTFYAWGGPHSSLPVQDIFWRAGGLAIVNAVFTPGLSLENGPIRPTSGWVGCFILQALMAEVAERLAEKGIQPPIYYALNMEGNEEYNQYMERLVEGRSTKFGGIYSPAVGPE
jgi:uncharacterized phosphosugar-binding protein